MGGRASFVVTSSIPSEGNRRRRSTSPSRWRTQAKRVALLDTDLRKPKVAEYLSIEGGAGLTDVLIGRAKVNEVMLPWGGRSLYVLPAGRFRRTRASCSVRHRWALSSTCSRKTSTSCCVTRLSSPRHGCGDPRSRDERRPHGGSCRKDDQAPAHGGNRSPERRRSQARRIRDVDGPHPRSGLLLLRRMGTGMAATGTWQRRKSRVALSANLQNARRSHRKRTPHPTTARNRRMPRSTSSA